MNILRPSRRATHRNPKKPFAPQDGFNNRMFAENMEIDKISALESTAPVHDSSKGAFDIVSEYINLTSFAPNTLLHHQSDISITRSGENLKNNRGNSRIRWARRSDVSRKLYSGCSTTSRRPLSEHNSIPLVIDGKILTDEEFGGVSTVVISSPSGEAKCVDKQTVFIAAPQSWPNLPDPCELNAVAGTLLSERPHPTSNRCASSESPRHCTDLTDVHMLMNSVALAGEALVGGTRQRCPSFAPSLISTMQSADVTSPQHQSSDTFVGDTTSLNDMAVPFPLKEAPRSPPATDVISTRHPFLHLWESDECLYRRNWRARRLAYLSKNSVSSVPLICRTSKVTGSHTCVSSTSESVIMTVKPQHKTCLIPRRKLVLPRSRNVREITWSEPVSKSDTSHPFEPCILGYRVVDSNTRHYGIVRNVASSDREAMVLWL